MDRVVKEELMRSIAVFFFALVFTAYAITKFDLPANAFTVLGIPLLITAATFTLQVRRRRGKAYIPVSKKNVAALLTVLFAVMSVIRLAYAFVEVSASYYSLAIFILLILSTLWYKSAEGELDKTLLAKHIATSSLLFILLGVMALSLQNLPSSYTVIWLATWSIVLLASIFIYSKGKG